MPSERHAAGARSPTSHASCSCRRARYVTTSPVPSARPVRVPVPRRCGSPMRTAGSCGDLSSGCENGMMTATETIGRPLRLGDLEIPTPVVLAPMAGVTNAPFRKLCREHGAGLYVCEMITSRGIVEGDRTSLSMLAFDDQEKVRSVQLYGIDPVYIGKAVEILCGDHGVDHVDLNFGCPVPKVTRKGG